MIRIELSDHTGDQVSQARRKREEAYAKSMATYDADVQAKRSDIAAKRSKMKEAWQARRLLAAIFHAAASSWSNAFGWPKKPIMQSAGRDERVWAAGDQGETMVVQFLDQHLSNDWTLVTGYRNSRGEIDQILVGPGGLITIEVKYVNGKISITGDDWHLDKYDNYGNLVESNRRIADRGGRSPSQQLNQSTDKMIDCIRQSIPAIVARRIVVLSHQKASLGVVESPTVTTVLLQAWPLEQTVLRGPSRLDASTRTQIVELLRRDHDHNKSRLVRRSAKTRQHPTKARAS